MKASFRFVRSDDPDVELTITLKKSQVEALSKDLGQIPPVHIEKTGTQWVSGLYHALRELKGLL